MMLRALNPTVTQEAGYARGLAFLAGLTRADGTIDEGPHGLIYPVYTAAGSLALPPRRRELGKEAMSGGGLTSVSDTDETNFSAAFTGKTPLL